MKLNFKSYNFTTKEEEGNALIFDIIRKKYVRLTPEEWVRQHVVFYLVEELGVPMGLISVERSLIFNGMQKRFDICVANKEGKMYMLVECKAPGIKITAQALRQAVMYNRILGVQSIFLSNGLQHYFYQWNAISMRFESVRVLPHYQSWI